MFSGRNPTLSLFLNSTDYLTYRPQFRAIGRSRLLPFRPGSLCLKEEKFCDSLRFENSKTHTHLSNTTPTSSLRLSSICELAVVQTAFWCDLRAKPQVQLLSTGSVKDKAMKPIGCNCTWRECTFTLSGILIGTICQSGIRYLYGFSCLFFFLLINEKFVMCEVLIIIFRNTRYGECGI